MKKIKSISSFKESHKNITNTKMEVVFGGKKVETVWVKDKLNDYYEDTNGNGEQDPDECLTFTKPQKSDSTNHLFCLTK